MKEKETKNGQEIFEKHHQGKRPFPNRYQDSLKVPLKQEKTRPTEEKNSPETELLMYENFVSDGTGIITL